MKTVIYYFTGTGNSLAIARFLAERVEGAEVLPIAKLMREKTITCDADRIGLVFPVYYLDIPGIVQEFLERLNFTQKDPYVFAVIHFGGEPGNTLIRLERLLKAKEVRLAFGYGMEMPDNSIFFTPRPSEQRDRLESARQTAERIAASVRQLKRETVSEKKKLMLPILSKGTKFAFRKGGVLNRKVCDQTKCSRCGVCVRACPLDNVRLVEDRVMWGGQCRECFACLQWCPNQAIRFGWLRVKESYHHPEVTLKDMAEQVGR